MRSDFKEGRLGLEFKNGKLYSFERRMIVVLSGWPDPRAWFKRRSHGWKATRKWADHVLSGQVLTSDYPADPEREVLPDDVDAAGWKLSPEEMEKEKLSREWFQKHVFERSAEKNRQYLESFPAEVVAELKRYGLRKWHLLSLFARCPGALDLSRQNPAVCYALASNWVFHKPATARPIRTARAVIRRKNKQILEWLGFPGTAETWDILARVAPVSLSTGTLLFLRRGLWDAFMTDCFLNCDRINAGVIWLVTDPMCRVSITPDFLARVGRDRVQDLPHKPYIWQHVRKLERLNWDPDCSYPPKRWYGPVPAPRDDVPTLYGRITLKQWLRSPASGIRQIFSRSFPHVVPEGPWHNLTTSPVMARCQRVLDQN